MTLRFAALALVSPILLAQLVLPAPAIAQQGDETIVYRVKQNDTLIGLAQKYMLRVTDYAEVQQLNRIANPFRIPVGTPLRIPVRLLRQQLATGEVVASSGGVTRLRSNRESTLNVGDRVGEGDRVVTAGNSFITVQLANGTLFSLSPDSNIIVRRLRTTLLTGQIERLIAVERGRLRATVRKLRNSEDFKATTPVSVSAVRGTEFSIGYDMTTRVAGTEVVDGNVAVSADAQSRNVPRGYGIIARADALDQPKKLLPAPRLSRLTLNPGAKLAVVVEPVSGAVSYRAELATDEKFSAVIGEARSTQPLLAIPALPDGGWFVRVSAIDPDGLQGMSTVKSFKDAGRAVVGIGRDATFRMLGGDQQNMRIQIMRGSPNGEIVKDVAGKSLDELLVTDLPNGTYYWRTKIVGPGDTDTAPQDWSTPRQLVISRDK